MSFGDKKEIVYVDGNLLFEPRVFGSLEGYHIL